MQRRMAVGLGLSLLILIAALAALASSERPSTVPPSKRSAPPQRIAPAPVVLAASTIDEIAESYVKLALAVGRFDRDYVDAYFGPPAWRKVSRGIARGRIAPEGRRLRLALDALPELGDDRLRTLRRTSLGAHLDALVAVMERLDGRGLPFEDEVRVIYDIEAPPFDEARNATVLAELDALLPGEGTLAARYASWYRAYALPADAWDVAFRAALAESRARTIAFVDLPAGEVVEIEYVTGKPWSAFNEYQGGYRSVVQVNRKASLPIGAALGFACHEAYPGHHLLSVLQDHDLVHERGWVEFSIHPLYAPSAVIAEGTACQAAALIFPGDERDAFLAETLFPLAGLDPEDAATYGRIYALVEQLDAARVEAARRMRAPGGSRVRAATWLAAHSQLSQGGAHGDLDFALHYGSYMLTYTAGSELVRRWLDGQQREAGPTEQERFVSLLRRPYLPCDLRAALAR